MPSRRHAASRSAQFTEQMLEFYARTGGEYEAWADGLNRKAADRVAEVAGAVPGEQALDVGCGTGLATRRLGEAVAPDGWAVGIDISEPMLHLARRASGGSATFLHMSAETLGFPDRSFDVITVAQSLPFMADPQAALAEAHRVLKPGGRIAVCCQRRSLATHAQTVFFACLGRLALRHPMRIPRPSEDRAVLGEPRVLLAMLAQAGFGHLRRSQTIVGGRPSDARSWTALMAGAGPYPHALISVLGPGARERFETELEVLMDSLDEDAYRLHHAFTLVTARRPV